MKTLRTRKKRLVRAGFTLLELLIVLAIIVSLAALVAPNLIGQQQEAKISTTRIEIREIENAVNMKASRMGGTYEESTGPEVIQNLVEPFEYQGREQRPIMDEVKKDGWGNPFQYSFSSGDRKPLIYSFGPNGQDDGGDGDDISNKKQQED